MSVEGVPGTAVAAAAAGTLLIWSGIKGANVSNTLRSLVTGQQPASTDANPVTGTVAGIGSGISGSTGIGSGSSGSSVAPVSGGGSNQAILQQTAAKFGWTGAQWTALANVEMAEAGFSTTARNPQSGALGMAQALGHGQGSATAGTLGNEYGGYGLTTAQAKAANSGDAAAQALWMCNYIRATYGTPEAAWAHEQSHHWY